MAPARVLGLADAALRRRNPLTSPATDHLDGMNDLRFRPRLLRSLVRDRLPDETRPSPRLADLADIPDYVKSYGLLSEALPTPPDRKLAEAWSSAVDAWVDRLLSLISSNAPDKCGVAIYLLGVTCEECSSHRFLASYSLWFEKLLPNIQQLSSSTDFVRVASCTSLSDLFTRLAQSSNLKKDAISLARKLIQPALQLLNESGTEAVVESAVCLLCTLMSFFPASMHSRFDEAEAVFVSNIISAKCSSNRSKRFASCLALLANVKGDEDSWCLMMQKILMEVNNLLSDAFQGIEEEAKSSEIIRLLVPPGKDHPPPLRGQSISGKSSEPTTKRLHELLLPRVSALMHCCCIMLTNPYPDQVTVPVRALLALVWRVLTVDGSLSQSLLLFTTPMQQELLCSELPSLHLDSLEVLSAIIKRDRSLLLPHAANVIQHLVEYFRRTSMSSIRIKLYSILQTLFISMRVGMRLHLVQEVIKNAYTDLDDCPSSGLMSSSTYSVKVVKEAPMKRNHRKRKHAFEPTQELSNGGHHEIDQDSGKPVTPISVKIAALRALQALLTVGGSLQPELWRSDVDLLLIKVARNACSVGWANSSIGDDLTSRRSEFQLAALEALLASLLSPSHVRPPYLSLGIELFTEGKHNAGVQLAGFCALALLALQVLVRPQSLPLDDFPGARSSAFDDGFSLKVSEATFYGDRTLDAPSRGDLGGTDDLDEELYTNNWLKSDRETLIADSQNEQLINSENPEHGVMSAAPALKVADRNQLASTDPKFQSVDKDEDMPEPIGDRTDVIDPAGVFMDEDSSKSVATEVGLMNVTAPNKGDVISSVASNMEKDEDYASKSLASERESVAGDYASKSLASERESVAGKEAKLPYDSDPPHISFPELVDGDPDSVDGDSDSDSDTDFE